MLKSEISDFKFHNSDLQDSSPVFHVLNGLSEKVIERLHPAKAIQRKRHECS